MSLYIKGTIPAAGDPDEVISALVPYCLIHIEQASATRGFAA